MEILNQDQARIGDNVLREMLYIGILDLLANTVWAEALNLRQSTRLTSNMVVQILQRIFKTDDKVSLSYFALLLRTDKDF